MNRTRIAVGAALALLTLFPFAGATFYTELVTKMMILAIFALSLDLLVGYTGLVSFGHAAFYGVGAYTLGLLTPKYEAANLWLTLPTAIALAGLAALAVGIFVVRVKGIYFIMRELPCAITLHEVPCAEVEIGEFRVSNALVCHPGPTVGYRIVEAGGSVLTYLPDHEPALSALAFPSLPREWTSGGTLAAEADLLIHEPFQRDARPWTARQGPRDLAE